MKYQVIADIGASVLEDVEADTPEQAIERATCHASLCHHCSREVQLGEPFSFVVLDEDGEEVLNDEADKDLRVKALEAVAKAARELWPWVENWLPDEAKDQGARDAYVDLYKALQKLDGAK